MFNDLRYSTTQDEILKCYPHLDLDQVLIKVGCSYGSVLNTCKWYEIVFDVVETHKVCKEYRELLEKYLKKQQKL